ncbi:hypothetical protein GCM10011322_23760 [Salinarimonas ramus]|uniref:Uncharacterized protein n=1 Tax=Salinarimonas ramus TaxID=690164 RepID=A0A917Q8R5_9HYPH|nr:hypothetical protein GCM10011322_23760 [Salinarimonas ramus]
MGKARAARTIIFHMIGTRAVFLFAFAKSDTEALSDSETAGFRDTAKLLADLDERDIERLLAIDEWIEVEPDEK